jgi:hypothetical protein
LIDAPCLCKAKTFVNAAQTGLAKACPKAADAQLYLNFINAQCSGQPNYPILLKQSCKRLLFETTWPLIAVNGSVVARPADEDED